MAAMLHHVRCPKKYGGVFAAILLSAIKKIYIYIFTVDVTILFIY